LFYDDLIDLFAFFTKMYPKYYFT